MNSYHNVMQDFIECNWNYLFPNNIIPSKSLKCSEQFYKYLIEDGVFIHNKYSRDKSNTLITDENLLFPQVQQIIEQSLKQFKTLFVKVNWKSGKDCRSWIGGLECTHIQDVLKLIKCSSYIAETLQDYQDLYPQHLYIILKQYQQFDRNLEFRCFINQQIISVCQRSTQHVFIDIQNKNIYYQKIAKFVNQVIKPKFNKQKFVADLLVSKKGTIKIIDIGPWREFTNPLLFEWDQLELLKQGQMKLVANEQQVMYQDLANYNKPNEEEMKWLLQEIAGYKS